MCGSEYQMSQLKTPSFIRHPWGTNNSEIYISYHGEQKQVHWIGEMSSDVSLVSNLPSALQAIATAQLVFPVWWFLPKTPSDLLHLVPLRA
ncbi:hypothetical protein CDAR_37641, partial [Caerostris darwini]